MRKYLIRLSLLAFCFMGMAYAVLDAAAPDDTSIAEKPKINNAASKWRSDGTPLGDSARIVGGEEFPLSDDCFSNSNLSESGQKGKGKAESIPSMSKLEKRGYKFFIAVLQNVSSSDLTIRRKECKSSIKGDLASKVVFSLNTRAPKVMGHLEIYDRNYRSNDKEIDPLWLIYQAAWQEGTEDKVGLFVKKRGEDATCILRAAKNPQLLALKIFKKKIETEFPGNISGDQKNEGFPPSFASLSLPSLPSLPSPPSLCLSPSLPSPPSLSLPSSLSLLFSADDPSSSSSSSATKDEESLPTDKSDPLDDLYNVENIYNVENK